jgi:hypothetical protein
VHLVDLALEIADPVEGPVAEAEPWKPARGSAQAARFLVAGHVGAKDYHD